MYRIILIILLLGVIYVCSLLGVYHFTKSKYRNDLILNDTNRLLTELLQVSFKNNSLASASQNILKVLKRFYSVEYITILLYNEHINHMQIIASNVDNRYLAKLEEYCNRVFQELRTKDSRVMSAKEGYLSYDSALERKIKYSQFVPLRFNNKTVGGVLLESKDQELSDDVNSRMALYYKIFQSTALVLQDILYTENLIKMTSTDQLTGVYNRRFIDMTLKEQLEIHRNLGMSMTLAVFDIDHFKKFNDTYGHQFGDIVLQEVAKFMQHHMTGENEWVARYGGEEFVLFFGRSDEREVLHKVERLRQGLSQLVITDGTTTAKVTASFGVASFPKNAGSVDVLIAKADEALYKSKENGRNRVTIA